MRSLGSEENIMHLLQHSCSCSPYHVVAMGELECVFGKAIMFSIWFNAFERINERYVNHCFHFACRNPVLRQHFLNCYKRYNKVVGGHRAYGTQTANYLINRECNSDLFCCFPQGCRQQCAVAFNISSPWERYFSPMRLQA